MPGRERGLGLGQGHYQRLQQAIAATPQQMIKEFKDQSDFLSLETSTTQLEKCVFV